MTLIRSTVYFIIPTALFLAIFYFYRINPSFQKQKSLSDWKHIRLSDRDSYYF